MRVGDEDGDAAAPSDGESRVELGRGAARVDDHRRRGVAAPRERRSSSSRSGRARAGRRPAARPRVYGRAPVSASVPAAVRLRREVVALTEIEAPGGTLDPAVLTTDDGARAIAIRLEAGQELRDHQVRERAWVVVVEGEAEIRCGDEVVEGRVGTLVTFDPGERHAIASQRVRASS